jgi:ABC-type transporter Mla subunit MlaD
MLPTATLEVLVAVLPPPASIVRNQIDEINTTAARLNATAEQYAEQALAEAVRTDRVIAHLRKRNNPVLNRRADELENANNAFRRSAEQMRQTKLLPLDVPPQFRGSERMRNMKLQSLEEPLFRK